MIVPGSFTLCADTLLCSSANSVTKVPSIKVHATQRKAPWKFKFLEKEKRTFWVFKKEGEKLKHIFE